MSGTVNSAGIEFAVSVKDRAAQTLATIDQLAGRLDKLKLAMREVASIDAASNLSGTLDAAARKASELLGRLDTSAARQGVSETAGEVAGLAGALTDAATQAKELTAQIGGEDKPKLKYRVDVIDHASARFDVISKRATNLRRTPPITLTVRAKDMATRTLNGIRNMFRRRVAEMGSDLAAAPGRMKDFVIGGVVANAITGATRAAVGSVRELAAGFLNAGAEADGLVQALNNVSEGRGAAVLAAIRNEVSRMPVALGAASKAYVNLRTGGIQPTIKDLAALSTVAAQMQGDGSANVERLSDALGRAARNAAIGKTEMNEMLGELRISGIPVIDVLQKELGLTEQQIANMAAAGVTSKQVLDGVWQWIRRQAANSGDSWADASQKAKNVWGEFQRQVADSGPFDALKDGLDDFLAHLQTAKGEADLEQWANDTGDALIRAFAGAATAANFLLDIIDAMVIGVDAVRWAIAKTEQHFATAADLAFLLVSVLPGMEKKGAKMSANALVHEANARGEATRRASVMDDRLKDRERRAAALDALEERIKGYAPGRRPPKPAVTPHEEPPETFIPGAPSVDAATTRRVAAERAAHAEIIRLTKGEVAYRQWAADQGIQTVDRVTAAQQRAARELADERIRELDVMEQRANRWIAAIERRGQNTLPAAPARANTLPAAPANASSISSQAAQFREAGVDEQTVQQYLDAARSAAQQRREIETQMAGEVIRIQRGATAYQIWSMDQEIARHREAGVDETAIAQYVAAMRKQIVGDRRTAIEASEQQLTNSLAQLTLSRVDYEKWALDQQLRAWRDAGVETVKIERYKIAALKSIYQQAARDRANERDRQLQADRSAIRAHLKDLDDATKRLRSNALMSPRERKRQRLAANKAKRQEERETKRLKRRAQQAADNLLNGGHVSRKGRDALQWAKARRVQQRAGRAAGKDPVVAEQRETNSLLRDIKAAIKAGGGLN